MSCASGTVLQTNSWVHRARLRILFVRSAGASCCCCLSCGCFRTRACAHISCYGTVGFVPCWKCRIQPCGCAVVHFLQVTKFQIPMLLGSKHPTDLHPFEVQRAVAASGGTGRPRIENWTPTDSSIDNSGARASVCWGEQDDKQCWDMTCALPLPESGCAEALGKDDGTVYSCSLNHMAGHGSDEVLNRAVCVSKDDGAGSGPTGFDLRVNRMCGPASSIFREGDYVDFDATNAHCNISATKRHQRRVNPKMPMLDYYATCIQPASCLPLKADMEPFVPEADSMRTEAKAVQEGQIRAALEAAAKEAAALKAAALEAARRQSHEARTAIRQASQQRGGRWRA